ncbi:NUDIX hydrolase [Arthrobacter sp. Br18]|uniref:NUDIX hydrolase n=1 Tax=Arthrobacter sp. Br18 TaxID=1312954 RepID=UPI00047E7168|nr:NUDIX hydrolase [Arthrobacter sp. Br18]
MDRLSNRLFPIHPDQVTAARSWVEHGERTPLKPRSASSVVLIRDSAVGTETYLSYRRGQSPLGVVGFPGGSIEESDDDPVEWFGPTPIVWARALGIEDHNLARRHVLAAIRELFEETGVLLAGPDASSLVEGTHGREWMKAREAINEGESNFSEILQRRGLGVRTDLIKPLSHWLSPDFAHRRFDTHYFAAAQPVNQEPTILESKGVWGEWRWAAREIERRSTTQLGDEVGQPNTVGRTLSDLSVPAVEIILEKIGSSRGCIAYLSHKRPVKLYYPQLAEHDGGLMLEVACPKLTEGGSAQRGR